MIQVTDLCNKNKYLGAYLILIAVGAAGVASAMLFGISLCPIYNIFGIPCPSCGMTRAFMSLPDVGGALVYHPLFFAVPFIPLGVVASKHRDTLAVLLIILFVGVWIIRMFLFFPHAEPMIYNENSLFQFIRNILID